MTNDVLNEATAKVKKLRRSRDDKMVAGVCGGVAKLLGVDAALVRILLVAAGPLIAAIASCQGGVGPNSAAILIA